MSQAQTVVPDLAHTAMLVRNKKNGHHRNVAEGEIAEISI